MKRAERTYQDPSLDITLHIVYPCPLPSLLLLISRFTYFNSAFSPCPLSSPSSRFPCGLAVPMIKNYTFPLRLSSGNDDQALQCTGIHAVWLDLHLHLKGNTLNEDDQVFLCVPADWPSSCR